MNLRGILKVRVYLRKRDGTSAEGEYDFETKKLTVMKGSIVSDQICVFRGAKTVEKYRDGTVMHRKLIKDITFSSASTAANFVTGCSTNGLRKWKDVSGRKLKNLIEAQK